MVAAAAQRSRSIGGQAGQRPHWTGMKSVVQAAAEQAAAGGGNPRTDPPRAAGVQGRDERPSRARVRAREGRSTPKGPPVVSDLRRAWVWTASPPPLRDLVAARNPSADQVPDGSQPLRLGWSAYNLAVAIPVTALLYFVAWVAQHPARLVLAAAVAAPVVFIWAL